MTNTDRHMKECTSEWRNTATHHTAATSKSDVMTSQLQSEHINVDERHTCLVVSRLHSFNQSQSVLPLLQSFLLTIKIQPLFFEFLQNSKWPLRQLSDQHDFPPKRRVGKYTLLNLIAQTVFSHLKNKFSRKKITRSVHYLESLILTSSYT